MPRRRIRRRKAFIISSGNRGDTEPLISLGLALLDTKKFDFVHICIHSDYEDLIPYNPRLISHILPFSASRVTQVLNWEFYKDCLFSIFTGNSDPIRPQQRGLANVLRDLVLPSLPCIHKIVMRIQPDLVVATALNCAPALTIAEHFHAHMILVNFQPITATPIYPYVLTDLPTANSAAETLANLNNRDVELNGKEENLETYDNAFREFCSPWLKGLNEFRERLGLSSYSSDDIVNMFRGEMLNLTIFNAYPQEVIPHCLTWPPNIYTVQPLADDYVPPGWTPEKSCPRLMEYLSEGEKPFCITLGSTDVRDKKRYITKELFSALRAVGQKRIVVLPGTTELSEHNLMRNDHELKDWAREHIFLCNEEPQYAWFLPKCEAMLCHAGAGTTFAGLRAGLPMVFAPALVDQFFWAGLIQGMGLGAVVKPNMKVAKADSYASAIREAMTTKAKKRAAEFATHLHEKGSGAKIAAEIISSMV